jgi:Zn-finger nucleic acid-binding protein
MQCPIDGETLLMTSREGVEIDYCPRCRGVWLDRGELDKIIERAGSANSNTAAFVPASNQFQEKVIERSKPKDRRHEDDDDRRRGKYKSKDIYKKNRTKSFLKEIFDFD